MKLLLILISFCYEVHSKVFLNKKNIFCIINLVLMKKQTLMTCICLGGILMKYAKMKGK